MFGDYSIFNDLDSNVFRHAKIEDIPIDFLNAKWFSELQSYHPWAIAGLQNGEVSQKGQIKKVKSKKVKSRECFPACYDSYIVCSKSSSG